MRKLALLLIAALVSFALIGCGGEEPVAPTGYAPNQSVEAYAYVHGGYVGKAEATTDAEGNPSFNLNEAFLPHTLAIVDIEAADWNEDNTASYVIRGNTVHVAKYVSYNDTNYVGETVGTALIYVEADEDGNPAGGTDIEKMILRNEANMETWWTSIADGGFAIHTEFGGDAMPVTTTSYGSLYKEGSQYWTNGLTWQGNMDAIEEAAVRYGVGYSLDEMTSNGEWELADAGTGATASDFKDYFSLIQLAAARLEME
ncbi:MAG: hypothetical protein ACLFPV_12640 [Spirochaetaceae bacterium]